MSPLIPGHVRRTLERLSEPARAAAANMLCAALVAVTQTIEEEMLAVAHEPGCKRLEFRGLETALLIAQTHGFQYRQIGVGKNIDYR